jgi:transmembrane sensor
MDRPGEEILIKYFMGGCTEEEEKLITIYLAMDIDQEYITSCMRSVAEKTADVQLPAWTARRQENAWARFGQLQAQLPLLPVKTTQLWKHIAVAAAVLCGVAIALLWTRPGVNPKDSAAHAVVKVKTDYAPGSSKALLILSDGSRIDLHNKDNGSLAVDGQMVIRKREGDQLVYAGETFGQNGLPAGRPDDNGKVAPVAMNTLIVPKGGQYEVVLPDGTKVWMNAASSLVFPIQFTGNKRIVTLKGEAYFEVAKNTKMPFTVQLDQMQVEVLGTHFNIMAYADEPAVRTTLIEGSVKLLAGGRQQLLKPGQEGLMNGSRGFVIKKANIEQAMAWKNGQFIFDNEDMGAISRRLSRWYNVSFMDLRKDQTLTYTGAVSKYKYVSEVLKMLELTGTIHYKIEDGHVLVTQATQ